MNLNFVIFSFSLLLSLTTYAQKDTLMLANGDRIIGEIKKMDRGVLTVKTPYSSSDLKIKWKRVESIKSLEKFLITGSGGERHRIEGLEAFKSKDSIFFKDGNGFLNVEDIVFIKPVKDGFVSRLNASVSFGYNFTKASNLSQLTLAGALGYTSDYYSITTSFNAVRSSQDDVEEIQRTYGEMSFNYFLKNDNFLILQSEFLSNSEQKLKLRMTNKLGFGRYFIHNNQMFLAGALGVAWNSENYDQELGEDRNSAEGFVGLEANLFDVNDLSLVSGITAYPSLTEKGRIRTDFKVDIKYNLPLDLFVKLGFNYNYDNKPVEGASYDDFIIRTTLGWEL